MDRIGGFIRAYEGLCSQKILSTTRVPPLSRGWGTKKSKINDAYEMQKDLLQVIMSFLLYNEVFFSPRTKATNFIYFWKQMAAPVWTSKMSIFSIDLLNTYWKNSKLWYKIIFIKILNKNFNYQKKIRIICIWLAI